MNALVLALLCPPSPSPVSQEPLSLGCIPELQRTCSVSVQGNMRSVHVDTVAGTGLSPKWQPRMQAELSFTAEVVLASVSSGPTWLLPRVGFSLMRVSFCFCFAGVPDLLSCHCTWTGHRELKGADGSINLVSCRHFVLGKQTQIHFTNSYKLNRTNDPGI